MFCEELCCMVIWFRHQIISFSFCCDKFDIFMLSYILHSLSKNRIVHYFGKILCQNNFLPLFLVYYWFRCMVLTIHLDWNWSLYEFFSRVIHDLMLVLNFLCVKHSFLPNKLVTSFSTFASFFLSGKNGKSLWS